jgi:dephospho-CoA kinase
LSLHISPITEWWDVYHQKYVLIILLDFWIALHKRNADCPTYLKSRWVSQRLAIFVLFFFSQEIFIIKIMKLIGLTGGISTGNSLIVMKHIGCLHSMKTGKSTVSKLLAEQNIPIIDADKIARDIVEPGRKANQLIRQHFGDEVFLPDGHLDRPKLGQIIFQDPEKRKILNHCTHPYVRLEMLKQAFYYWIKGADVVIFDVPLLIESKLDRFMSTTVVVFW